MRIVLSGGLPQPRHARELALHLQKAAPTLARWFQHGRASRIVADPVHTMCTALEFWQLQDHGFRPAEDQPFSAGLGPLLNRADSSGDAPVWLLELVHLAPSRDGAVLIPASDLDITPSDSAALLASAQPLFSGTGFSAAAHTSHHWRITLPEDWTPRCPSPALVSASNVNDWWTQDPQGRPWRRLANELQMLWFEHTVNQHRMQRGLAPINGVWLFGGARPSQLPASAASSDTATVDTRLARPLQSQDWAGWLATLETLEHDLFRPHAAQSPELILTGHDHIVRLTPRQGLWDRLWPRNQNAWMNWWSPQN